MKWFEIRPIRRYVSSQIITILTIQEKKTSSTMIKFSFQRPLGFKNRLSSNFKYDMNSQDYDAVLIGNDNFMIDFCDVRVRCE